MPGFDRTGPRGFGSGSGRGLGPCFRGYGFGRGYGMFYAVTKEQEIADLKAEKQILEEDLKTINERLKDLEKN